MICFDFNIGIARTSKAIASKYYWENSMHSDVTSTIKACQSCQKSKPRLKKAPGRLHSIPIAPKVTRPSHNVVV